MSGRKEEWLRRWSGYPARWIVFINAIFQMVSSASLVMHLTFVSWRSNFVLDGWMDSHPRVQHSNNNKLNNYQQNCFNPSRNLSGSRLNFTSLIRKGKVSPGLYLSTSTQLDWKKKSQHQENTIKRKWTSSVQSTVLRLSMHSSTASQGLSSYHPYTDILHTPCYHQHYQRQYLVTFVFSQQDQTCQ